jgi:4-hydroxy-3-methylbut-2-en-1-yl diphosphate reductase
MIVIRAQSLGLCTGVRRALQLVEEVLAREPGTLVQTLGPLIHNPRVVEQLRARGVVPVNDASELRDGVVIVRTHGIGPAQRKQCEKPGVRCVDATCAHVTRIHRMVLEYDAKGYSVIVAGDPEHEEVKGIRGYARQSRVVASPSQAEETLLDGPTLVVGQTTLTSAEYAAICAVLVKRKPDVVVQHTLCSATEGRQESLRDLAAQVDAILVIGGKQSANTRRLFQTALAAGKPAWHIESAAQIPAEIASCGRVGLSAGASTPDDAIDEVELALGRAAATSSA